MANDIDKKLCLTAALLGAVTRKDLAAAFRQVNPHTPFDIERAHKWLQGRARPRERQLYEDWAQVLGVGRSGIWIADCDLDDFLDVISRARGEDRGLLLRRAQAFGGGDFTRERRPEHHVDATGVFDLTGTFVTYSFAWSPYFVGRIIRGALTIERSPGGGFAACYSQALGRPGNTADAGHLTARGAVTALPRALLLDLREPNDRTAFMFTLFPPFAHVSVLGGLLCGPAVLGIDPQPSVSRVFMARLPQVSPRLHSAENVLAFDAIVADLTELGAPVGDPAETGRRIAAFMSNGSGAAFDHVTVEPFRALVELFDRDWIERLLPSG
jgi:hypothetical protein